MLKYIVNALKILGISFFRFRPIPRVWIYWLVAVNFGCLYFITHIEAQVVLAVTCLAVVLQSVIYERTGFTRILGTTHLAWIPMFAWLATRVDEMAATPGMVEWVAVLFATNAVSFVVDMIDATRYARGERAPYYRWEAAG